MKYEYLKYFKNIKFNTFLSKIYFCQVWRGMGRTNAD